MNTFILKIIALISMTMDHFGVFMVDRSLHPDFVYVLRCIGRTAFVIYCFQLSEGIKKTHDKINYLARLLIFGFVSQIPFNLVEQVPILSIDSLNVFFSLALIFIFLLVLDLTWKTDKIIGLCCLVFLVSFSFLFPFYVPQIMYGNYGIILTLFFYFYDPNKKWTIIFPLDALLFLNFYYVNYLKRYSSSQWWSLCALIFIFLYNGKKGKTRKHFFYYYYPLHLLVFWVLSVLLGLKF